jgi:hypothetical protein
LRSEVREGRYLCSADLQEQHMKNPPADAAAPVLMPSLRDGVVRFKPTQDDHPGVFGRSVDEVTLLAGEQGLGAPWWDLPPHSRLGIAHASARSARAAFAMGDAVGASVDYLVLCAGRPLDIAGFPAISLPLPCGALQIVGKPGGDGELLQLAADVERLLIGEPCVSP